MDIYCCFVFDRHFKICEVSKHQKQSACKRLFQLNLPTLHFLTDMRMCILVGSMQNYVILLKFSNIDAKNIT